MDNDFEKGYRFSLSNLSSATGSQMSGQWIDSVQDTIDEMSQSMVETSQQKNLDVGQLQGFMAEIFHKSTLNANAKIHHSSTVATQPDVNTLGSADVTLNNGLQYSLKYYKTGSASAAKQAESLFERYSKLKANAEKSGKEYISFEEFLRRKGLSPDSNPHQSLYFGQGKLIPTEQLEDAKRYLREKIEKESVNRPELAQKYREVLESLTDVVSDGKGNCSVKLTRDQAQALAQAAKSGNIDKSLLDQCGLKLSDLVTPKDIMDEAFRAGMSAAVISLALSVAPVIVNCISKLISTGELSVEELKTSGFHAASAGAKSFLTGALSAAVTTCCKTGRLGEALMDANPSAIGALVVLSVETVECSLKFALGKISKPELAQNLARLYITTAFSSVTGVVLQAAFPAAPVVAYLIGSFVGSVIGGFVYSASEKLLLSFCVSSGCTFFGLVTQDYKLPQEVLDSLGVKTLTPKMIDAKAFQPKAIAPITFAPKTIEYKKIEIKVLDRGIIGVYKVGYV